MKAKTGERLFDIINISIMLIFVAIIILPLLNVVSTSLVSLKELASRNFILFPKKVDFGAYRMFLFGSDIILNAYKITLFRVIVGTFFNMTFTYFVAYALTKKDLPGNRFITYLYLFTMLFSGGTIPIYVIIKSLGMLNNIWLYIIQYLVLPWYLLLMKNFIATIPRSIFESVEIDGAGELRTILSIVLPLSLPAMATVSLFYAVNHWNYWWDAFMYVSDPKKQPIQLILRNILAQASMTITDIQGRSGAAAAVIPPVRSMQTAAIVITTLPIVIVYPFLQKYFVKGVMMGAIKG